MIIIISKSMQLSSMYVNESANNQETNPYHDNMIQTMKTIKSTIKSHLLSNTKYASKNSYSLMIIFRNGNCQISYYLPRNQSSKYTRKINGVSFAFDLIARLVTNLDSFLAVRPEYDDCSTKKCHRRYSATYFSELRECFLKYILYK